VSSETPRCLEVSPERAGARLDAELARLAAGDVSRTQVARHISEGAVTVNGAVCPSPSRRLRTGDRVEWLPPSAAPAPRLEAEDIPLEVVFEDASLIVINKPAGLVVHPAPGHESGTLVNALLAHCQDLRGIGGELRPGIVHRLDKDTSGLMVAAKDDQTMGALAQAFSVHDIERAYDALVVGRTATPQGRIETLHGRDPHNRKKFTTRVRAGKKAITNWRIQERIGQALLMEARLETGRTHQVRVHMSAMGCPLLGDPVYARAPRDRAIREIARRLGRQALHARILGFRHPKSGDDLRFEVAPPADFQAALVALRILAVPSV